MFYITRLLTKYAHCLHCLLFISSKFINSSLQNSLSSLHIFVHHCTFYASLHVKTSPGSYHPKLVGRDLISASLCCTIAPESMGVHPRAYEAFPQQHV